jgi:hypothetical protein
MAEKNGASGHRERPTGQDFSATCLSDPAGKTLIEVSQIMTGRVFM